MARSLPDRREVRIGWIEIMLRMTKEWMLAGKAAPGDPNAS
jgi:hypothetical protein